MTEHKCIDCGTPITGRANKKRCDGCRRKHVRKYQNERNAAIREATPPPWCIKCGEEFERTSPGQKYCPKCQSDRIMKSFRPKKRVSSLAECQRIAKAHGLSYGQAEERGLFKR